jgi:hypothetical protein
VSQPSHYQDYVAIGLVQDVIRKPGVTWLPLLIDVEEPCYLAVCVQGPPPEGVARGDLIWLRGVLRSEKAQGARHGLPYVLVKHLARLRRSGQKGGETQWDARAPSGVG